MGLWGQPCLYGYEFSILDSHYGLNVRKVRNVIRVKSAAFRFQQFFSQIKVFKLNSSFLCIQHLQLFHTQGTLSVEVPGLDFVKM